jgi:SAM-dependent methyltransferase
MSQNIYDDPGFFDAYSRLPRSVAGLAGAPELPALRALLPDMCGLNVIDLGCGYGWFCRWARESGAARVLGIDVSGKMLARARSDTADTTILYMRADMERLALRDASFDIAYSSLALHYVVNLEGLLATVKGALVAGGQLVFSVEHPIFTAPSRPGWSIGPDRGKIWPLDNYLIEGPRRTDWLAEGVVKQHRTLATYLNMLLRLGFVLSHIAEWGPSEDQVAAQPALADERQRPPFLIVAART